MKTKAVLTTSYYAIIFLIFHHTTINTSASSINEVTCPGQPPGNFCDCAGDCTGQPEWCSCAEAQDCCRDATPTVLCPGQPTKNYCDCDGDCMNQPTWCACAEARTCCSSNNDDDDNDDSGGGGGDVRFLQLAFNRYAGSDGTMDHGEWDVFVRHMKLLSCDDDGTVRPGVKLVLKDGAANYANCDGEYPLLFGERWNGHEVYVNKMSDRILMFRYGSWLITGYHWWPDFKRNGGDDMGGGFQQSELGATSSIKDSNWTVFDVIPVQLWSLCEDYIEKTRTDAIWDDVDEPFFSYNHFLTALRKVALDRNENNQDRNTVHEIYQWIAENHANEEHTFCHNGSDDEGDGMRNQRGTIIIKAFNALMVAATVFIFGFFIGKRHSAAPNTFTPLKSLE